MGVIIGIIIAALILIGFFHLAAGMLFVVIPFLAAFAIAFLLKNLIEHLSNGKIQLFNNPTGWCITILIVWIVVIIL